jgi:hypothetical protein
MRFCLTAWIFGVPGKVRSRMPYTMGPSVRDRVSELCELLGAETDSNPRIVADPAIENERLELAEQETPIWDLMEAIYLDRGWKLHEHGEKTLILRAEL